MTLAVLKLRLQPTQDLNGRYNAVLSYCDHITLYSNLCRERLQTYSDAFDTIFLIGGDMKCERKYEDIDGRHWGA